MIIQAQMLFMITHYTTYITTTIYTTDNNTRWKSGKRVVYFRFAEAEIPCLFITKFIY